VSESKVLYKCEDCGCEIIDRGDGTAEISSPNLFGDCESCEKASLDRMRELGQKSAQRINDEYMRILSAL